MASIRGSGFWFMPGGHTFVLVLVLWFCSALTTSKDLTTNSHAESWLREYGYLAPLNSTDTSSGPLLSIQDLSEAIREMQRFYNLEVTGQMDQQTTTAMKRPRCGVHDKTNVAWSSYKAVGRKWDKYNLTYSIHNVAPKLAWYETSKAIHRAFQVWENASQFHFEKIHSNVADIMIYFDSGAHKAHDPFGTWVLAHASPPRPGSVGDMHFNSDKQWSYTNQNVQDFYNVFLVAVHELGHSLGLDHSSDTSSIMHPDYHWMDTDDFQLPAGDRQGIQLIYGVSPPTDLTVVEVTSETVELSWANEMTVTEYLITYVPTAPGGLELDIRVPGDQTLATLLELKPGIEYLISVYAVFNNKTSVPVTARVETIKLCPSGWKTFGVSCYYRTTPESWQGARDYCLSRGADLVVINSPEEQVFIRGLDPGARYSWIGLTRGEGRWTWVDGTPLTTTQYWLSGYPRNNEDWNCAYYLHRTDPGTLANFPCSDIDYAICEK